MKKLFLALGVVASIGLSSCNDVNVYKLEAHQGAFVLNQGSSKSTISYYNYEREECTNDYYQLKNNGASIGAGATTMAINRNSDFPRGVAYVTVPNDNSVELINLDGFIDAGNIDDYTKPNDVLVAGDTTIYVSHENNKVSEYDVMNNNPVRTFDLDDQPQKLISSGKYLYAACKGDANGSNVFVVDMSNNILVDTVELSHNNPIDMVVDTDRRVWIYCNSDEQALVRLDREFVTKVLDEGEETERDTIFITNEATTFVLGEKSVDYAKPLTISPDGRTLYYVYGKLWSNSVYIENEDELKKNAAVTGNYSEEAFNGIDYDSRRNRLMGLTTGKQLVVLRNTDEGWTDDEVYTVGDNPIMTSFNY